MDGRTYGRTYVRTDGRKEIHPCVLQDIGPLGPLPKKVITEGLTDVYANLKPLHFPSIHATFMEANDAGSQYHCGGMGRGFQPPITSHIREKYLKRSFFLAFRPVPMDQRTDGT